MSIAGQGARYFLIKNRLSVRSEQQGWLVMARSRSALIQLGNGSKDVLDCVPAGGGEAEPILRQICEQLNIPMARAMDVIERFVETGILSLKVSYDNGKSPARF